MSIFFSTMSSPIGQLSFYGDEKYLFGIDFERWQNPRTQWQQAQRNDSAFETVRSQLNEYFAGARRVFDLQLKPSGTDFQNRVWTCLQRIPFGETWSYGELAKSISQPKAVRAVGMANGRNPIPIVIPCHRVIGANGRMVGYGGGLAIKDHLLRLEGLIPVP